MATTTTLKPAGDAEAPKKKKSKKKLIIILVPVLLLLGVGGYLMLGSSSSTKTAVKVVPKPGFVTPLDPITVNLSGAHFLKIGLALQGTVAVTAAVDGSMALDLAISLFTNQTIAALTTDAQRERFKAALTVKVAKAYENKVYAVYFTSFVMQ